MGIGLSDLGKILGIRTFEESAGMVPFAGKAVVFNCEKAMLRRSLLFIWKCIDGLAARAFAAASFGGPIQ